MNGSSRRSRELLPPGWGLLEPVSEEWDVARISEYFRDRAPMPTTAVVLGDPRPGTSAPSIATLSLERSSRGVHEIVTFLAETADPLDGVAQAEFAATMHQARARHAVLGHGLGYTSLARPVRYTGATVPACAVFGAETLQRAGAQRGLELARGAGQLLGSAPVQSMAVCYPPNHGRINITPCWLTNGWFQR